MNGEVPEIVTGLPAKQDHAGASPALSSIEERLRALGAKGWSLHFSMCDGIWSVQGDAGDSNCHHPKEYDPSDGHGFSYFDSDDNLRYDVNTKDFIRNGKPEHFESFEAAATYAESEITAIVPGQRR
jgi:hypothetical protein